MKRLLLAILFCIPGIPGCGGPAPDPEAPIKEMVSIVEEYVSVFKTLGDKKEAPPEEANKALEEADKKLNALKTRMDDALAKAKAMTKTERDGLNKPEYRDKLRGCQDTLRRASPQVQDLLRRRDLGEKHRKAFAQTWLERREQAEILDRSLQPVEK